jgi:hypothetical protein
MARSFLVDEQHQLIQLGGIVTDTDTMSLKPLPSSADLDDVATTGWYTALDSQATIALHYPVEGYTCVLQVFRHPSGNLAQTLNVFSSSFTQTFTRIRVNGAWNYWVALNNVMRIPNAFIDWLQAGGNGFRDLTTERFVNLGFVDFPTQGVVYQSSFMVAWGSVVNMPPIPSGITPGSTVDVSLEMSPVSNMGYEVRLMYSHVAGKTYDCNPDNILYIGRWAYKSDSDLVVKWGGWKKRVLEAV